MDSIAIDDRDDGQIGRCVQRDQIASSDAKRGGDPVKPVDRDCPRSGLETTDRLGRRRGQAPICNVMQRKPLRAADFTDACYHGTFHLTCVEYSFPA